MNQCSALQWPALHCTELSWTALLCTALHFTALQYTVLHFTKLYWAAVHCTEHKSMLCTVPSYTALYWTLLHCSTLYYTTLHCTTLHYTTLQPLHYSQSTQYSLVYYIEDSPSAASPFIFTFGLFLSLPPLPCHLYHHHIPLDCPHHCPLHFNRHLLPVSCISMYQISCLWTFFFFLSLVPSCCSSACCHPLSSPVTTVSQCQCNVCDLWPGSTQGGNDIWKESMKRPGQTVDYKWDSGGLLGRGRQTYAGRR